MTQALELKNVTVKYNRTCALSAVNLSAAENDFLAVIGPNGGGKSTLLKTILGIVTPVQGEIKIFGKNNSQYKEPIGYVPQFSSFRRAFPITVEDVVLSGRLKGGGRPFRRYEKNDYRISGDIMDKLQITQLRRKPVVRLSGGQLQKVLLARALAAEPRLLLLDEPTASLDSEAKNRIYEILKQINQHTTIILVTHDLAAISSYIKNIACLNKKLYYHGEPEISEDIIHKTFGCPVDLIAHGVPHRVLRSHGGDATC
jgi:zinc transport system ATP-binding protein